MKKIRTILLTGILAACLGTASAVPVFAWNWNTAASVETTKEDMGLVFTFEKTTIHMDDDAETVFKTLTKSEDCFEQEGKSYKGTDRIYTYDGFELGTYEEEGGKEKIRKVVLLNDSVATPEGLTIGSSFEDMTTLYGTGYEKKDESYQYTAGNTRLKIVTKKGKVNTIVYELLDE